MGTTSVPAPKPARPREPKWPVFMAWVIVALNLVVLDLGEETLAGLTSARWASVEGTVIDTRVWQLGPRAFLPAITYEFGTDHGFWRSGRFGSGSLTPPEFSELAAARQWLHDRGYVAGATAAVYAHPSRPALSVLEPGARTTDALLFGTMCFLVLLLDVWLILALWRAFQLQRYPRPAPDTAPRIDTARSPPQARRRPSRQREPVKGSPLLLALAFSLPVLALVSLNVAAVLSVRDIISDWDAAHWLQVQGHVTAVKYDRRIEHDKDRRITRIYPILHYAYTVEGREFSASRYGLRAGVALPGFRDPGALERYLADHDYRVGRPVIVHYRADAPGRSVLNPERRIPILLLIALGIVTVLAINWVALQILIGRMRLWHSRRSALIEPP